MVYCFSDKNEMLYRRHNQSRYSVLLCVNNYFDVLQCFHFRYNIIKTCQGKRIEETGKNRLNPLGVTTAEKLHKLEVTIARGKPQQ